MTQISVDNDHISTVLDSNEFLVTPFINKIEQYRKDLNTGVIEDTPTRLDNGDIAFLAYDNKSVEIIDYQTGQLSTKINLNNNPRKGYITKDGRVAYAFYDGGGDYAVKFFDSNGNEQWKGSGLAGKTAVTIKNGKTVALTVADSSKGKVRVYDNSTGNTLNSFDTLTQTRDDEYYAAFAGSNDAHILYQNEDSNNNSFIVFQTVDLSTDSFKNSSPERKISIPNLSNNVSARYSRENDTFVIQYEDGGIEIDIFDSNANVIEQFSDSSNNLIPLGIFENGNFAMRNVSKEKTTIQIYETVSRNNLLKEFVFENTSSGRDTYLIGESYKNFVFISGEYGSNSFVKAIDISVPQLSDATYKLKFESLSGVTIEGKDYGTISGEHLIDSGKEIRLNGLVSGFRVK